MKNFNSKVIVVLVTCPVDKTEQLAKLVLSKRLAACINIINPIKSLYWWEGKIEDSEENLLIIKTTKDKYDLLKQVVEQNHPYTIAEIVALAAEKINQSYYSWLIKETNP